MKEFKQIYKLTVELFNKGQFDNVKWRESITNNLLKLEKIWPDKEIIDLEDILEDYVWRIEQIKKWSELDRLTIEEELYDHGSLFFYDIKKDLSEEERDQILTKFWDLSARSTNPNSIALFRLASGKLKTINKNKAKKSPKNKLEKTVEELDKIEKHNWSKLYDLSIEWEVDETFTDILKYLKIQKSKLMKKDYEFFVDMLNYLVNKGYIYRIDNVDKSQITTKVTFNKIIDILNRHA